MESLVIFCGILALSIGLMQLFFPKSIDEFEQYIEQLFNVSESSSQTSRRIIGLLMIIVSIVLFYLIFKYDLNQLL